MDILLTFNREEKIMEKIVVGKLVDLSKSLKLLFEKLESIPVEDDAIFIIRRCCFKSVLPKSDEVHQTWGLFKAGK